ncbi:hypothetical protein ACFPVX_19580 [Cohnella faecalis]|uniref:hypothetical protein n=1 Tax=Cohnella faecalis TaxID=2315694 RepID=UPI0011C22438|nr:hypothetical protein [Cohnella faecalis]
MVQNRSNPPIEPLRRLLDPEYPLCRDDVLWALDHVKRKVAEGAPEWSGLDRPQLLAHFVCFADIALMMLHRRTLEGPESASFRKLLSSLTNSASCDGRRLPYPTV